MKKLITEENWPSRHRPRLLKDIVGNKSAVDYVKGMFETERIPKSILITGPSGSGKTTLAKIIARKVNNTKDDKHPDIHEFNASSERGIDNIRALVESTKFAPMTGQYKIFIADEAHGLTGAAASALLTNLENPPEHVVWILATNEPQKLLQTIKNRASKIEMRPISSDDLKSLLQRIAEKEKVFQPAEKHSKLFDYISLNFEGRTREAIETLNTLSKISVVRKISKEDVNAVVREISGIEFLDAPKFLGLVYRGKKAEAFEILSKVTDHNGFSYFILDLNTFLLESATGLRPSINYARKVMSQSLGNKQPGIEKMLKFQEILIDLRRQVTNPSAVEPRALLVYHTVRLTEV